MRLVVTDEQRELRDALRRFFADRSPASEVRRLMETADGHDPEVWALMAGQLGLPGLAIPAEHGPPRHGRRLGGVRENPAHDRDSTGQRGDVRAGVR
ncbi:acyl-CoA dehydrogenase family protein [Actinomadura macra]|uniref:acyl-CoA dehydrogenase family protein n=1 Tax=Actinomadura macra TaxID=46164 RepID=UPI00083020ED|nr:acyl-CoA dehydrogenase family protein [Actinomadura macra]